MPLFLRALLTAQMLILFDHSVPAPLRDHLKNHTVAEAVERGWHRLSNRDLLTGAEEAGFDVLLTTDKNMKYQQNLAGRKIAIVVLTKQQWPELQQHAPLIAAAVLSAAPGSYTEVEIPFA